MINDFLTLKRHQNAGRKAAFSGTAKKTQVQFASLLQAGALAGGGLGALKGGLDQNEDGTQTDPGNRLMNVATNAAAGTLLGSAAGGGIPQLLQESPAARNQAQTLYNTTGVNLDRGQIPLDTYDAIQHKRAIRKAEGKTLPQRIQHAVDPVTGRLRVLAEDVSNITRPVAKPLGNVVSQATNAVIQPIQEENERKKALRIAAQQRKQDLRQAMDEDIYRSTARIIDEAGNNLAASPGMVQRKTDRVNQTAQQVIKDVYDTRPGIVKGAERGMEIGKQALAAPFKLGSKVRGMLPFSYMGDVVDFGILDTPYTNGAAGGALLGTAIGGGIGLANSVAKNNDIEQGQLDQIQAIPDPYARKQEWDNYDSDLSRTGRNIGYGVSGAGNTAMTAGLVAAGGALVGGGALTALARARKAGKPVFGQPKPTRMDGLRLLVRGA